MFTKNFQLNTVRIYYKYFIYNTCTSIFFLPEKVLSQQIISHVVLGDPEGFFVPFRNQNFDQYDYNVVDFRCIFFRPPIKSTTRVYPRQFFGRLIDTFGEYVIRVYTGNPKAIFQSERYIVVVTPNTKHLSK